ncbi:hypothetical protein Airi02_056400 [Actinoallomurus iriomotensis]|uniref:Uncharacterized protein n=1 Tax=Actinoallomurus iriomotensis TaxID=478107 RepID=A0A9W6W387_9ACTN|nr:hypothetical protein Airi02_056400 [Actinoallomurus iriomotensis]
MAVERLWITRAPTGPACEADPDVTVAPAREAGAFRRARGGVARVSGSGWRPSPARGEDAVQAEVRRSANGPRFAEMG